MLWNYKGFLRERQIKKKRPQGIGIRRGPKINAQYPINTHQGVTAFKV